MYLKKTIYNEKEMPIEIELLCEKCGSTIFVKEGIEVKFDRVNSDYCKLKDGIQITCCCGNFSDTDLIAREDLPHTASDTRLLAGYTPKGIQQNVPKCPTCSSTNITRISTASKVINAGVFGLLGNKRKKTFHCNNCRYEW